MKTKTVERGNLAAPDIEGLEISQAVSAAWEVDSGSVKTCVAEIYFKGASKGEGRQQLAHLLALEMKVNHGLDNKQIDALLREWNMRVSPPLPQSELDKIVRRLDKPGIWAYSCKHPLLRAYCIGEICTHATNKGRWKASRVSANGLTSSGWLPQLSGAQVRVFLGLYRLARLKGRGPRQSIPFTFGELERVCGVSRGHVLASLEHLLHIGLLADFKPSQARGKVSSFRFPAELPDPTNNIKRK